MDGRGEGTAAPHAAHASTHTTTMYITLCSTSIYKQPCVCVYIVCVSLSLTDLLLHLAEGGLDDVHVPRLLHHAPGEAHLCSIDSSGGDSVSGVGNGQGQSELIAVVVVLVIVVRAD